MSDTTACIPVAPVVMSNVVKYQCPYCSEGLALEDTTRDGKALYCVNCDTRVEFVEAVARPEYWTATGYTEFKDAEYEAAEAVRSFKTTLEEPLAGFKAEYGDTWHLMAIDRLFHLHNLTAWSRGETTEYSLLKKWLEDMVEKGVRATEGQ